MLSMVLSTLTRGTFQVSVNKAHLISDIQVNAYNLDLDAHDTFRRHPERFLKVLFSLNLRPLPKAGYSLERVFIKINTWIVQK